MNRQLFDYHPVFGFCFLPSIRARIAGRMGPYLVQTNSQGFRSVREYPTKKAPGTFRILVFGDSFTAGDGVSNSARYSDRLEKLLPGVETFNFGLPGSGTDQQYLVYRELGSRYEHDLVVVGLFVENIHRVVSRYRTFRGQDGEPLVLAKPYFDLLADGSLILNHVPVPREPVSGVSAGALTPHQGRGSGGFARKMRDRIGPDVKTQVQRLTRHQPFPEYEDPAGYPWQLLRAILCRWTSESTVPVVLLLIPFYRHIEETTSPTAYQARFAELDLPPHVRVHDPLTAFHAWPRGERQQFRFANDPHMTAAGHDVLAASLADAVRPLLGSEVATE